MTSNDLDTVLVSTTTTEKEEDFSYPLDISDIISICREFNNLGWSVQNQVEYILEVGVEESIKTGKVKQSSLPYIKKFLKAIQGNVLFGSATDEAEDVIKFIKAYEDKHNISYTAVSKSN